MRVLHFAMWIFSINVVVLNASVVSGQDYPNKPIRLITSGAGGATDFTARLIAQGLSGPLGQPVIVDNRASAVITGEFVSKAPPDGYILLTAANSLWVGPLFENVPYDPVRDFSPITLAVTAPTVLVVHPSLPVKSVKELIALVKARPGELNYGSGGTGSSTHLATELFKYMAGDLNIVRINYKGGGPALSALIGGEVQFLFSPVAGATPHIKSGRLRALAVTSAEPSALFPGLPTVAASGLPGYQSAVPNGIVAPAKTPTTIINRLNQEIVRVLNRADVKEKFFNNGVEVVGNSPEQFAAYIKSDMARLGKVFKNTGIRLD